MEIENNRESIAIRVSLCNIMINILLSLGKLAAGVLGHSAAMISDAIHSASDVFATLIVIGGVKVAARAEDKEHPYGHERMECVASIILATILVLTGLGIGLDGIRHILNGGEGLMVPTLMPLIAAVISIAAKEAMFWYTRYIALEINSDAIMADAWHNRSDAISSVGSLIGVVGARFGYPILDPVASIVISLLIIYSAYNIFKSAIDKMVDRSCNSAESDKMKTMIEKEAGVAHIDRLQTRLFGDRIFVDVEVSAADDLTLLESHRIAENIHLAIENNFPEVKHCMVHINPVSELHHDF
jgi:cation diffusion facilitator family transporter